MAVPDEILGRYTEIQGLEYGTRFYRADLHFHTPASSDARGRNKYGFNPYVVSHLTGKIPADASVLEGLKGLRDLKFLRKHRLLEGMRKLDIDDLERIESKVLKDVELLRKILDLRSLKNKKNKATGDHEAIQELDAGIRASVQDIQSLEGIQNISLAFLECEEIKSLQLLKAGDPLPQVREKVASELESKLFEIRVIKDLKILNDPGLHKIFRDQPGRNFHGDLELDVPAAGYPSSVREFQYQIYLYAKIKAAQIVCGFLEKGLSLVAVTDHNGIGTIWVDDEKRMDLAAPTWYELLDDATRKANERWKTKLQILPGVEISATGIHILAIFPRQEPRRKVHFMICDLLNSIGITPEKWGKNPAVGWASPYDTIEQITKKGGLAIPAHIDGSDQALLDLHDLTSGAMKNVLGNENLSAVEILDPGKFTDKGSSLKAQLEEVRRQKGLPSLAYFQGSDSHDMVDIAKRFTYLKMTEPSFDGLKTAIKIPSLRVRIEASYKEFNGLYIRGMAFDHPDLGARLLRFNRNLNCITGRIGAGKRILHDLIQAAVNPARPYPGKSKKSSITNSHVTLFVESISDHPGENKTARPGLVSRTYAFHREAMQSQVEVYFVDPDRKTVVRLEEAGETTAPRSRSFMTPGRWSRSSPMRTGRPSPTRRIPSRRSWTNTLGCRTL